MGQATGTGNHAPEFLMKLLGEMLLIRRFEEKSAQMYGLRKIGGFLHLCIGEEAIPVGAMDGRGVTISMGTGARKLSAVIPWRSLSGTDVCSLLSALSRAGEPEYYVGAAMLCMSLADMKAAAAFLDSAQDARDVSFEREILDVAAASKRTPDRRAP